MTTSANDSLSSTSNDFQDMDVKCELMDKFAVMVQLLLASLALCSLLIKRQREVPRRPFKVWFFDVSKQAMGASGVHVLNLLSSYISGSNPDDDKANPCVLYFLNLLLDTTIGVGILWCYLRLIDWIVGKCKISDMQSGMYGNPPQVKIWLKQTAAFFIALSLMKCTVIIMLQTMPVLERFGRWVLLPLTSIEDTRFQVVFVLLLFPLVMNIIQFWIVDTVIKENAVSYFGRIKLNESIVSDDDFSADLDAEEFGNFRDMINGEPDESHQADLPQRPVTPRGQRLDTLRLPQSAELSAGVSERGKKRGLGGRRKGKGRSTSETRIRLLHRTLSNESCKVPLLLSNDKDGDGDTGSGASGTNSDNNSDPRMKASGTEKSSGESTWRVQVQPHQTSAVTYDLMNECAEAMISRLFPRLRTVRTKEDAMWVLYSIGSCNLTQRSRKLFSTLVDRR